MFLIGAGFEIKRKEIRMNPRFWATGYIELSSTEMIKAIGRPSMGWFGGLLNLRYPLDMQVEMLSGKMDIVCSFTVTSGLEINLKPS